jgi:hypothetical protein
VWCLWAVCCGAPSEGPPPVVRPRAPELVWSSRWSPPGTAGYSEGPLSSWSECDSRAIAYSAGIAGARRASEIASRRLWSGGASVVLVAPSAAFPYELHVKHRRLAPLDSIGHGPGADGGFGSRCCTWNSHSRETVASHRCSPKRRPAWAAHQLRCGRLPEVGPLKTADGVVLSARTICAALAPPVDLWCVPSTPAGRALGSSEGEHDRSCAPAFGDWTSL